MIGMNDRNPGGVFVSNERDREMRRSSAQGAELDSSVCKSSFRENRTNSQGHFNGGAAARSSLDQGSPESKSLSCAVLRETVLKIDACPGTGDNGNGRWLVVTKARRTMFLIMASSLPCASLEDC